MSVEHNGRNAVDEALSSWIDAAENTEVSVFDNSISTKFAKLLHEIYLVDYELLSSKEQASIASGISTTKNSKHIYPGITADAIHDAQQRIQALDSFFQTEQEPFALRIDDDLFVGHTNGQGVLATVKQSGKNHYSLFMPRLYLRGNDLTGVAPSGYQWSRPYESPVYKFAINNIDVKSDANGVPINEALRTSKRVVIGCGRLAAREAIEIYNEESSDDRPISPDVIDDQRVMHIVRSDLL